MVKSFRSFFLILTPFLFMQYPVNAEVDSITDRIIRGDSVFLESIEQPLQAPVYAMDSIASLTNFHIPFTIDEDFYAAGGYTPMIKVIVNDTPVKIGVSIDGANEEMLVYDSFLRKIYGQNFINNQQSYLMSSDININGLKMGKVDFAYSHLQEHYPSNLDGCLYTIFFSKCHNIIIDYRNNEIIVNAPAITSNGSPMHVLKGTCSILITTVKINGIEQNAVISPTLSSVYLRDDYKNSNLYSDDEILAYCFDGKPRRSSNKSKDIKVTIDGIDVLCKGYFTSHRPGEMKGNISENMVRKINILGYPVFKGHRIQLDFYNGMFRMD